MLPTRVTSAVRQDLRWCRAPAFTDRHSIVFDRVGWKRIQRLAEPHLAAGRFGPLLFPHTSHAVLRADTPKRTLHQLAADGAAVRNEAMIRLPLTRVSSAPRATVYLDDAIRSWALQIIGLPPDARDGQGIVVGLVDSGVDLFHPALAGSVTVGTPDGGRDSLGHGTHCAGIIVGRPLAAQPRFGIAPAATLRSYRLFGPSNEATEGDTRELVRKAVGEGCRVIVLAGGTPATAFVPEDGTLGQYLASRNCLMVAAAGNESNRLGGLVNPSLAPANAPGIYSIGAVTAANALWNSSNGKGFDEATRVDVVAPGVDVLSAWPGGRTLHMSGTSMATAVTAGVVTALWSRSPGLSATEIGALLLQRTRRPVSGPLDGVGAGLVSLPAP